MSYPHINSILTLEIKYVQPVVKVYARPNDFKVGNDYVDRAIFDSLAKELCEFKSHITSELKRLGGGQVYRDQLN